MATVLALLREVNSEANVSSISQLKAAVSTEDAKNSLAKNGGIVMAIDILTRQPFVGVDVCDQTLSLLLELAYQNSRRCLLIAQAGGVNAVLNLMMREDNAPLLTQCLALLVNLSSELESNRQLIATAGGIPVVIGKMKAHLANRSLQQQSARLLANLAFKLDDNQALIVNANGLAVILKVSFPAYPISQSPHC